MEKNKNLAFLAKQIQDNAKVNIMDELILTKISETLQNNELFSQKDLIFYCFDLYNSSLIFGK